VRGRGTGLYAQQIHALFHATARRLGFSTGFIESAPETTFRRPERPGAQLRLF
jgi:hypothetical protein